MADKRVVSKGTIVLFGAWLLVLASALLLWRFCTTAIAPPPELMGVLRPAPTPIEPFRLTDHNGEDLSESRLLGKWTFLFFGYTYCPDVCPTVLAHLASVHSRLRNAADGTTDAQALFVSVDPDRDTPERLAEYISYFDQDFVAATGDTAAIDGFAKQFGAGYILEEETTPGEYLVSHTSAIFLIDPRARLIAAFSQPHHPDTIVSQFDQVRAFIGD